MSLAEMVLLDTNICIFLLNQKPGFEHIIRRIDGRERDEVVISSITEAELQFGVAASRDQQRNGVKLALFLAAFHVAPFDSAAAASYGAVRAHLKAQGTPIGPLDTLIAGHALSLGATVITRNTDEFQRVPALQVEDWTAV